MEKKKKKKRNSNIHLNPKIIYMLIDPILKCNLHNFLFMLSKLPLVTQTIQQLLFSCLQQIHQCRPVKNEKCGIYYMCTKQLYFGFFCLPSSSVNYSLLSGYHHSEGTNILREVYESLYTKSVQYIKQLFFLKHHSAKSVWKQARPNLPFPVSLLLKKLNI